MARRPLMLLLRMGTQTACASGRAGDAGRGCGQGQGALAAVGQSAANAFGLHDMIGNVKEWTCSDYTATYGGRESRCAMPASPLQGVARGAAWSSQARETRGQRRGGYVEVGPRGRGRAEQLGAVRLVLAPRPLLEDDIGGLAHGGLQRRPRMVQRCQDCDR